MPGLDHLLSRVVERKGYSVQGADDEALFAKKGEESLLAAWKTDAPLTPEDARMFVTAMEQVQATSGILVAARGTDPGAKEVLSSNKAVEVWPESRLIIEVGEAFVKGALDAAPPAASGPAAFPSTPPTAETAGRQTTRFPSLLAQAANSVSGSRSGVAMYVPNRKKEQPPDMQAEIQQKPGGSLGYAWGGAVTGTSNPGIAQIRNGRNPRLKTDQWGNVIDPNKPQPRRLSAAAASDADVEIITSPKRRARAAPEPAPTPPLSSIINADEDAYEILPGRKDKAKEKDKPEAPVLKEAEATGCTALKTNIGRDEAIAKSGKAGSVKLALVPHVAFSFDLEMNRPGMTAPVTGKGAAIVNSLTGELRVVDELVFAEAEPEDARKDAEKMTAVDVYDKVKGHVSRAFARSMNVEREVAGNTVMETVKLAPDSDEMGLEHRGIVHVPVWEITSSTGVTRVDAYTGDLLG